MLILLCPPLPSPHIHSNYPLLNILSASPPSPGPDVGAWLSATERAAGELPNRTRGPLPGTGRGGRRTRWSGQEHSSPEEDCHLREAFPPPLRDIPTLNCTKELQAHLLSPLPQRPQELTPDKLCPVRRVLCRDVPEN